MKIGLIRGAYLSQFEMQTYEHLLDRVELEAYHIRINRFPTNRIKVPVRHLACIDDPFTMVSPKLGFYFDLFLQATNGMDYYHVGLEKALAEKDIAHTMETFKRILLAGAACQATVRHEARRHGVGKQALCRRTLCGQAQDEV